MKSVKSLLLIFTISLSFNVFAQSKLTAVADKAFNEGRYFEAIELYKKSMAKEKNKAEKTIMTFKMAECFRLSLDYKQAEKWYEKAVKAKYHDPIAQLHIANIKKARGEYAEAIVEYQKYKEAAPGDKRGENGIKSCELAQKWKDAPTRHVVAPETQLNTKEYDFAATFSDKKNNALIFSSTRKGSSKNIDGIIGEEFSALYETKRDKNGKWSTPSLLGEEINTNSNEGAPSVNSKGTTLFFTRCPVEKNKVSECKIYEAKKKGTNWTDVTHLEIVPDTVTAGHPSISDDETILFFSSNLQGGFGGKDIWYVLWDKKTKTWGSPINAGASINTEGDEMFPFIRKDGTLYFSSNGHLGMGGLDIFKAEKTGENKWGNVENMKYPINSSNDDYGIIFEGDEERGFLTSNREGTRGGDDIFSFVSPPLLFVLQGVVTDIETKKPIKGATVSLTGTDGSKADVNTDDAGFYIFAEKGNERYLNPNVSYNITVTATDYLIGKAKETTVGIEESTTFIKDFAIQTTKKDGKLVEITFPDVLYDLGKFTLRPESKDSLDFLYQVLIDNPTIVIELSAHTDSRGSAESNQVLSENRAKACVEYLVSKGIDAERMVPVGYGKNKLLVTDEQIAKMPTTQEKEAGHQKNRRTVFSVLRSDYAPKDKIDAPAPNDAQKK
jgi:peptidoglycan-associated lipoprotein